MRPIHRAAVAGALLLVTAGCGGDGDGGGGAQTPTTAAAAPTTPTTSGPLAVLAIVSPASGAEVKGNVVRLDVTTSGIEIVAANGDTSGRTGHFHVFVDKDPVEPGAVIPVEAGVIHTTDDPIVIPGLRVGPHRLSVIYGDGTHKRIGFTEAGTSFTVAGPSIDATTPPNAAAGQPVVVTVQAEGIVFPEDGRLYLLVDRAPPAAGEPIPDEPGVVTTSETTISVPDLAPGTHTIWVVAGSTDRLPLDPAVMDRVTLTVA